MPIIHANEVLSNPFGGPFPGAVKLWDTDWSEEAVDDWTIGGTSRTVNGLNITLVNQGNMDAGSGPDGANGLDFVMPAAVHRMWHTGVDNRGAPGYTVPIADVCALKDITYDSEKHVLISYTEWDSPTPSTTSEYGNTVSTGVWSTTSTDVALVAGYELAGANVRCDSIDNNTAGKAQITGLASYPPALWLVRANRSMTGRYALTVPTTPEFDGGTTPSKSWSIQIGDDSDDTNFYNDATDQLGVFVSSDGTAWTGTLKRHIVWLANIGDSPPSPRLYPEWTVLRTADAIAQGDPTPLLDGATIVPNGYEDTVEGINVALLDAGTATLDPGDAAWWIFDAVDTRGNPLVCDEDYQVVCNVETISAPGLGTDTMVFIGVCNETDLNSATVDGYGWAVRFTGSDIRVTAFRIINGVITATDDAAGSTSHKYLTGSVMRVGADCIGVNSFSLDVNGDRLTAAFADNGNSTTALGSGPLYSFYAVGRSSVIAGAVPSVEMCPRIIFYPTPSRGGRAP